MLIWKALVALNRLVVVSKPNIDGLSIDSTREGSRESEFEAPDRHLKSNFEIVTPTIKQAFESSFQALSICTYQ